MDITNISYNFSIAKIISILMVVVGHYYGGILWIPTTIALFIFAFSSGFFTGYKYHQNINLKDYWYSKFIRLIPSLLVINVFLLILFVFQKRAGIQSWEAIVSMMGLSGFFTWFGVPNISPFGHGLWFFTLLLLFYLFYPLIRLINKVKKTAVGFIILCLILLTYLNYLIPMGHALWLTIFAFVFGSYFSIYGFKLGYKKSIFIAVFCLLALVVLNIIFEENRFNYILIMLLSISIVLFLVYGKLPRLILNKVLVLSGCVIHIYFIHTYLFFKEITDFSGINFLISFFSVLVVSYLLYGFQSVLFRKKSKRV